MNIFTPINNTTIHFNDGVSENIRLIPEIGEEQFLTFWTERLILAKEPINKKIKENKIVLPGRNLSHMIAKKDQVLTPSIISRMRSAYKFRNDATTELFQNEIFGVAQSISQDSMSLYHGVKTDLLKGLSTAVKPINIQYNSSLTIDLSGIINVKANMNFPTFK